MKQLHIVVSGEVQGVGFRYYAQTMALSQQVTGWVRNCLDGSVEIVVEGEKERIDKYLSLIQKGSPFSNVQSVTIKENEDIDQFQSFKIKY